MKFGSGTIALMGSLMASVMFLAQFGGPPPGPPPTGRTAAPEDVTGYWVSLVTEDWRYRMVTPCQKAITTAFR